ncbi:MAG: radical SAM protein, partial [Candidatus Thermoplasmatota archaeon]|nr:radical SAM protein [Candidatus Thermoplasmatota archaeon]
MQSQTNSSGGHLLIASWNVTNKCNLFCEHCYREAGKESKHELTTREGFSLLDEIAKAGFKLMVFSGGEPFMREDIMDILWYAKRCGFEVIIYSNGSLIDERIAEELSRLRPN